MVITRSPHLTRQRTRQQGIILNNEGNQIRAPVNQQQNIEILIPVSEQNEMRNLNEPINPVNDVSGDGSILSETQLRLRLLEVDPHEFGEFEPAANEERMAEHLALVAPMVNAGSGRLENFGRNVGEINGGEIRNLPPIGHLFERNEDFEDSWVRERPPSNAPLFESTRHGYFNVDRVENRGHHLPPSFPNRAINASVTGGQPTAHYTQPRVIQQLHTVYTQPVAVKPTVVQYQAQLQQ
ncbi:hypothetical protein niasHT_031391 [Heterodera trifolii]|uniref:Uncharacterized protein n=1 Tax=Heterodera trifolii TaxID=157864 RepID=A0ABD2J006_9BILA